MRDLLIGYRVTSLKAALVYGSVKGSTCLLPGRLIYLRVLLSVDLRLHDREVSLDLVLRE